MLGLALAQLVLLLWIKARILFELSRVFPTFISMKAAGNARRAAKGQAGCGG